MERSQSKIVKYAPCIVNTQINLFNVQEQQADYREMCRVGGQSVSVSLRNTQQPESLPESLEEMAKRDGAEERDTHSALHIYTCGNAHTACRQPNRVIA